MFYRHLKNSMFEEKLFPLPTVLCILLYMYCWSEHSLMYFLSWLTVPASMKSPRWNVQSPYVVLFIYNPILFKEVKLSSPVNQTFPCHLTPSHVTSDLHNLLGQLKSSPRGMLPSTLWRTFAMHIPHSPICIKPILLGFKALLKHDSS